MRNVGYKIFYLMHHILIIVTWILNKVSVLVFNSLA